MTIGNVICTDTTTSASNSTGSLRTAGGFHSKNAYIGQQHDSSNATFSHTLHSLVQYLVTQWTLIKGRQILLI